MQGINAINETPLNLAADDVQAVCITIFSWSNNAAMPTLGANLLSYSPGSVLPIERTYPHKGATRSPLTLNSWQSLPLKQDYDAA